jgi:nucleoside-diphosphate-sugar epimerase|tara:strand:- start:65 stop:1117 length:1053 start_codon:yes stop_codon:yes gene_type:complete
MTTIDKTQPVLVTGANGYVASWLVKGLLEEGFTVRATVRDKTNQKKVGHLLKLAEEHAGKLSFHNADLFDAGAFDEAMAGCELVFHTASPFIVRGLKDPQKELIEPALQGTRNVLESANKTDSVKRVVLTSSVVSIYSDNIETLNQPNGVFSESDWNTTSSLEHQPYNYSKTLAEKEAWKIAKDQSRWDLVVMNPGLVLGPSLAQASDSTSLSTLLEVMDGTMRTGAPDLRFPIVDVRDVATAHIRGAMIEGANGRHILVSSSASVMEIAGWIKKAMPGRCKLPLWQAPKFLIWLIAPIFGITRDFVKRNVGYPIEFDNSRAKEALALEFATVEKTVVDHAQQIIDDGLI